MKLVLASSLTAVLLGVGALVFSSGSYAQEPYCLPGCIQLRLECVKGNQTACASYDQMCMNCMERSAAGPTPPVKHDNTAGSAWVNSRQATLSK